MSAAISSTQLLVNLMPLKSKNDTLIRKIHDLGDNSYYIRCS